MKITIINWENKTIEEISNVDHIYYAEKSLIYHKPMENNLFGVDIEVPINNLLKIEL